MNYPKSQKRINSYVEKVFLIYRDGRLISYASLDDQGHMDEDIVGSMMNAIVNLIKSSLVKIKEGKDYIESSKIKFGDRRLIIEARKSFFMAIVIHGKEDDYIKSQFEGIVSEIEERYSSALEDWGGELTDFEGAYDLVLSLFPSDKKSEERRQALEEYGERESVFDIWSRMYRAIIHEGIIPKPQIWKDLHLNINVEMKED